MVAKYASAKHSIAECDRCGFRFKLKQLKALTIKTKMVNILVCQECWEADHPQLQLGMYPISDPQAVENPRPDMSYYEPGNNGAGGSREIQWGWDPVGGSPSWNDTPNDLVAYGQVGTVTITSVVEDQYIVAMTGVNATAELDSVSIVTGTASDIDVYVTGLDATASVGTVVIPLTNFDYAVVRFIWTTGGGTDLDTRTAIIDSGTIYDGVQTGWCKNFTVPVGSSVASNDYYLAWGGDNTGSGTEAHLINFDKISTDFPALTKIYIEMRAFWFSTRVSGNLTLQFETYSGGTMQVSGYDFINVGGSIVQTTSVAVNAITSGGGCQVGDCLQHLEYDVATKTASLYACP